MGCSLWLDAADTATMNSTPTVTTWSDKSGNANNMTGTATYSSGTMTFNGSTQAFSNTAYVFPSNAYSMFAVYSNTTAPAAAAYMNAVYGNGGYPMLGTYDTTKAVTARSVVGNAGGLGQTATATANGWATRIAGSANDVGFGVATDSTGNVFVTGQYQSALTLYNTGGGTGTTLTVTGGYDVFLAKYLSAGSVVWATRIAGTTTSDDIGTAIARDSSDNVFVTGRYGAALTLYNTGGGTGATLTNAGGSDVFLAKYSSAGSVLWATRIAGSTGDSGQGVATDSSGNVFVTGYYTAALRLYNTGGGTYATLAFGTGSVDVFLAKYSSAGSVVWATRIAGSTGTSSDYGTALATDLSDNVFVTGYYSGVLTLYNTGGGTGATLTWTNIDCFLAKYSSAGSVVWATRIASGGINVGQGVATDSSGNVFVTGYYGAALTLYNTGGGTGATLAFTGGSDVFLAKYSSAGSVVWATRIAGTTTSGDISTALATDSSGNVFVTGYYGAALTLYNTGGGTGATLAYIGGNDAFLAKYSSAGSVVWATQIAGTTTSDDRGYGLATDSSGNVFVTGQYQTALTLYDTGGSTSTTLANAGGNDVFLAKYPSTGFITGTTTTYSGGYPASSNVLVDGTYAPSSFSPYVNGSNVTALSGTVAAATGLFVGGPSNYFNGSISEVLVYSSNLTSTQRQTIEGYLAWKWGIKPSLPAIHPFYSLPAFSRVFGPLDIPGCALWLDAADQTTISSVVPSTAYFPFDGSILDQSNVITFTTTGSVPYVTGKYGQAVSFSNASGSLSSNYLSSTYILPTTFTVSLWFQSSASPNIQGFFCTTSNPSYVNGSITIYSQNGNVYCAYSSVANNAAGYPITANTWYHAAITYNSGTLTLYMNGVQSGSSVTGTNTRNGITLGGSSDAAPNYYPFTGLIDDLRIYNSVLTAAQISNIYVNTLTTNVSQWSDKANGYNASNTVAANQPLYVNGTVRFNGVTTSMWLDIPTLTIGSSAFSIFFVMQNTGPSSGNGASPHFFWPLSGNGSGALSINYWIYTNIQGLNNNISYTLSKNQYYVISYTFGVTTNFEQLYANGTSIGTYQKSSAYASSLYRLGAISSADPTYSFDGNIGEVLIYNTALTTTQRQQIEGYLAAKWGLLSSVVSGHPFKSIPPSTSQPPQFQEVTPGNWKYDWQPYLSNLAAANNPTNATVIPTLSYGVGGLAAVGGNGGVLGPNNCVYWVSTNLMIYNITTNTVSSVTLSTAAGQRGGVLGPNGYLYFGGNSNILVVNPSNNSYSYINITGTGGGQTTAGGVLAPNGNIYYSTYYAARSIVVNTSNNTVSSITLPGAQGWIGACLAPNGLIYAVPYGATSSVLVINPNTNTYSNITPSLTPALNTQNYTGCVLGPNGLIYGIPYSASNILIINPATNSVTYGTGGPSLSPALSTQTMYCGVLAPNGNIYGMPSGASNILIINTSTNAVSWGTGGSSLSPALSTQSYASAVLAPNGNIYAIPTGASNMLIISNTYAQLPSSNCCLSAFLNKY